MPSQDASRKRLLGVARRGFRGRLRLPALEKSLPLQEKKKDLFKSIVSEDGSGDESLLRSLTREDLDAILS